MDYFTLNIAEHFFILSSICLLLYAWQRKQMLRHIKNHYPELWQQATIKRMGFTKQTVQISFIDKVIKAGTDNVSHDDRVSNYRRNCKVVLGLAALFCILSVICNLYFSFSYTSSL
ncbi:hypothetical protein [Catenovulum sediminis]|uniref:hypothetical protein n=1 Tax=Catenovulum sediminis TaxID=1740262 RepID=UPI00117CFAF0|nr:hypothetical protein [Catenovulum sediminis]